LAVRFRATRLATENAIQLGTGFGDLAIVLLEPSDREEQSPYEEILADKNCPYAVRILDESLRFAFNDQRNIKNTIVLDARPFRSRRIRESESQEERLSHDKLAYEAIEEVLALLSPKLIVVCHCDKDAIEEGMPKYLCSSVSRSGTAHYLQLANGHKCVNIHSHHPMYAARTEKEKPLQRIIREYLFDATFVVAANALVGYLVSGFGIANLRGCAQHGPAFRIGSEGVTISYQWMQSSDVCSSELRSKLKELGLEPKVSRSNDFSTLSN
jgi:hypothetical protein